EDGIRDFHVTGVQTCALPISREELKNAEVKLCSPIETFRDKYGANFGPLLHALMDPSITIVAHNALFEQVITRFVFGMKYMYSKIGRASCRECELTSEFVLS